LQRLNYPEFPGRNVLEYGAEGLARASPGRYARTKDGFPQAVYSRRRISYAEYSVVFQAGMGRMTLMFRLQFPFFGPDGGLSRPGGRS
jgi:hypothetical protein